MSRTSTTSPGREILPEVMQARIAAEQRRENRGVCEQDVAGALAVWRHPEEHVEFTVSRFGERMRLRHIDRLSSQYTDGFRIIRSDCILRQVHVKHERCDIRHPAPGIEILRD